MECPMNRFSFAVMGILLLGGVLAGCSSKDDPMGNTNTAPVQLSLSLGSSSGTFAKTSIGAAADSIQIDSAVVVFQYIKFTSHVDSVIVDTTGENVGEIEHELELVFRGPFVIHIQPQTVVSFANQSLPPGNYDGISFKVHRLMHGERYEDSREFEGKKRGTLDTLTYGSSLLVWGKVYKNGEWVPFRFAYDGELKYKLRGNFTVAAGGTIDVALQLDPTQWFRDAHSGSLLDPTDPFARGAIREALKRAFMGMRGGHDHNHDGHPDDN
jgi:hypothetical protein